MAGVLQNTNRDDWPALLGGIPAFPAGPPDWPFPDEDVVSSLHTALNTGNWGKYHGGYVTELEQRVAHYHGIAGAVAWSSGTLAVEMALRALRIGPGDEVILAAYDYPGNFLSVHAVGARPVLVDVAASNWNLNPALLTPALSPATRAVLVSHLHGGVTPMRQVMEFANAHQMHVVEDAAQAPGALVDGKKAGSWGDAAVWSFGGSKLLTAGRGGILMSRHPEVLQRARVLAFRGNLIAPLSELQAAAILPQLEKLDARNQQRWRRVRLLQQLVAEVPGLMPLVNASPAEGGYYKVGWQLDAARFGLSRKQLVAALRAEGVAVDEGFTALHLGRSPQRFRRGGNLTEAERASASCLILHHPILLGTDHDIQRVAQAIRKAHAFAGELAAAQPM